MACNTAGRFEEEDETWIPLVSSQDTDGDNLPRVAYASGTNRARSAFQAAASSSSSPQSTRGPHQRPASNRATDHSNNLQSIQRGLESRVAVQENLVNHPVDLFWKRFLVNLVREVWALEIRIRLGLFMLIAGLCTRLFVYSTWYILYPRVAVLTVILSGSVLYLDPFDVQRQLKGLGSILVSPDKAIRAMEQLDLSQLRRLSFGLFLIPTMLEIRTLSFLSQIKAEAGWTRYNLGIGVLLLFTMLFLYDRRGMKPRDCSYQGMLILYGSALLITVVSMDLRRIPFLAAPFFTATGTLLLTYQDNDMEWLSRIVRHSLRLTLRDVLSSVGERVAEDEMLQLAILRWICDFWTSNHQNSGRSSTSAAQEPVSGGSGRPQAEATSQSTPNSSRMSNEQLTVLSSERPSGGLTANEIMPATNPSQEVYQRRDVQWEELLPMLSLEIDHMEAEVEALQSENGPSYEAGSTSDGNASGTQSTYRAGTGRSGQTDGNPSEQPDMQSFEALKSMLISLNVDDRAKPAVLAYRRAVESFPPGKRSAVVISVLRRTPALLTLLLQVLFGGSQTFFASFVILLPFIVMEYLRIIGWIDSCQRVASVPSGNRRADNEIEHSNSLEWGIPNGLENADAMTILLCGDSHSTLRPPTLLLVWHNIASSVNALEVGLTAARCAETTAVAVDFAGNVMDLVQFGFEVSQQGLLHGLLVMAKEAISLHVMGVDMNNLENVDRESARFTRAAVRAVQSGQRVARNMHLLSEDEHVGTIVQPLLVAFGFLTGQGWLWGQDSGRASTSTADDGSPDNNHAASIDLIQNTPQMETDAPAVDDEAGIRTPAQKGPPAKPCSPSEDILTDQVQDDSIPHRLLPEDDLSEVMEMVSKAYEQGLVETEEKNDFYEKLSRLQESELYDVSVVSGMKRTLKIILENGCMTSVNDDTRASRNVGNTVGINWLESKDRGSVGDAQVNPDLRGNDKAEESVVEIYTQDEPSFGHDTNFIPLDRPSETVDTVQQSPCHDASTDDRNGALVKLGVAALGVVAGGILLSMRGRTAEEEICDNVNRTPTEGHERNDSTLVEIEELSDDDREDDWVSVPQ